MESLDRHDEGWFLGINFGKFDRRFNSFGAAGGKPAIFQIAGSNISHQFCKHTAQWIDQFLAGHGRSQKLGLHRRHHFRVAPAQIHHAKAAQKVNVFATQAHLQRSRRVPSIRWQPIVRPG